MKQDVIIGAVDLYQWNDIKNWVTSIDRSGFQGRKMLLVYRVSDELKVNALSMGVEVYEVSTDQFGHPIDHEKNGHRSEVHALRFYHIWQLLTELGIDNFNRVIATDVKDVIFQTNPSTWLDNNLGDYEMIAPSEGIMYNMEEWNENNMKNSFGPFAWELMTHDMIVCNVGTIAGKASFFAQFAFLLWSLTKGHSLPSDQSGFNLIAQTLFKDKIKIVRSEEGWCATCAVALEPKYNWLQSHLLDPIPVVTEDGLVTTTNGTPFALVHQYDRVSSLNNLINNKYN